MISRILCWFGKHKYVRTNIDYRTHCLQRELTCQRCGHWKYEIIRLHKKKFYGPEYLKHSR